MLLLIDNFDSFTYNLVQYFANLGETVCVRRNDVTLAELIDLNPERLVVSPGPGTPDDAGVSLAAVAHFSGKIPVLGVCLGHQVITQVFGGRVVRAREIAHGKVFPVVHDQSPLFTGLPNPMQVTRYHSLVAEPASLPDCLLATSRVADNGLESEALIMSLQHRKYPIFGLQFHPESIATEKGELLLQNFLKIA